MKDKLKLGVFGIVSTALFLGLAVLGWGSFAAFFAHPARIAVVAITFALVVAAPFTQGNLSPGEREDRANRWVLAAFLPIGLLAAYLPAWSDRTGFWTIDGDLVRWLGVALCAAGGVLRLWPLVALTVLILLGRIHSEEALLRSQFGAEYDAYRARTWRLIPGLY